jgi:hypothetical protein
MEQPAYESLNQLLSSCRTRSLGSPSKLCALVNRSVAIFLKRSAKR